MKFDYTLGKEATFQDWVDDGCKKAEFILQALDKEETENPEGDTKQTDK